MADTLSSRTPYKGKNINLRIRFLDSTVHAFQVPVKAVGQALWDAVTRHLTLVEADYFGLQFEDTHGLKCWLDYVKPILKQLPSAESPLDFLVKFYTPDPGLLEEYTRYLYSLQVKADLACGAMPCSENTAALIASYIVQAEIGDFIVEEYLDASYLEGLRFVPNQPPDFLLKVREYHKQHIGESPAEAETGLLDTARKVETYGIRMCLAKDHEGVALNLAVAHLGIQVFQNNTKINTFSWAKIRKLSFRRKKFLIKLHPETYVSGQKGYYKDTVEFFFESRDECKNFWKRCLEHHAFFRCHTIKQVPRHKSRIVSRGSSFRYSGRTQKQLMSYVRESPVPPPQFQRSVSGRISAASRSTSVTPKIPAKVVLQNSTMDTHNSTASSGSHVFNTDVIVSSPHQEQGETHSIDSSHSGSHSLHSPKFDRQPYSHEGTPGMDASFDSREVDEILPPTENAEDRGANLNVINTKVSESVEITNVELSANQNASDNVNNNAEHLPSLNPVLVGDGERGGKADSDTGQSGTEATNNNDILVESTNTSDSNNASRVLASAVHDGSKFHTSLATRESKKVAFAEDVKNHNELTTSISGETMSNTSNVKLDEGIPASACVSVSADISPSKMSSLVVEHKCEANVSIVVNDSTHTDKPVDNLQANVVVDNGKACQESDAATASGDVSNVGSEDVQNGASQQGETKIDASENLIEDIPYYLQRRHFEPETIQESENEVNNGNVVEENKTQFRRGRSSKKRRPINMQVEHVRVYEGSLERPVLDDSVETGLKSPSVESGIQSRSPSGKRSPSASNRSPSSHHRGTSRSSLDRSPSCNRRVEVINFHKLPPKDNFSSVDDTTSPTFEKDIFKQIHTQKQKEAKAQDRHTENSREIEAQNGDLIWKEDNVSDIGHTKVPGVLPTDTGNSQGSHPSEVHTSTEPDVCSEICQRRESEKLTEVSSIEILRKEIVPLCIDITEDHTKSVIDFESPAAAFIMGESGDAKTTNRNSITFSTFKPDECSKPKVHGQKTPDLMGDQVGNSTTDADYGSLPSAKSTDNQRPPLQFPASTADIFPPMKRSIQISRVKDTKDGSVIHGPNRPRKVSFHRERGYTYSFESVNDPPNLSIASFTQEDKDVKACIHSPCSDVGVDAADDMEDMVESDTESCGSCSDSDSPSEQDSSDEEDVKHDEFLKFAKSLAELGKEITVDSGVGVDLNDNSSNIRSSPHDPLEPLENLDNTQRDEEERNAYNTHKGSYDTGLLDRPMSKSYTDSSLSSCDLDNEKMFRGKRASIDPLAELENAALAEVESFSDTSSEEGTVTLTNNVPSISAPDEVQDSTTQRT